MSGHKAGGTLTTVKFEVKLVPSADGDLDYFKAHEQKAILDAISKFLEVDANVETKRRKRLRPNPVAPWELRIGNLRVYYDIEEEPERVVYILAVGIKQGNNVIIGKEVMRL